MLGDQNLGFWVKNGAKTVTTGQNSLLAKSVWNIFAISQNYTISEIAQ